jgi:hypothetical protein
MHTQDYIWLSLSGGPEHTDNKSWLTSGQARHPLLLGTTGRWLQGGSGTLGLSYTLATTVACRSIGDCSFSSEAFYRSVVSFIWTRQGQPMNTAVVHALQTISRHTAAVSCILQLHAPHRAVFLRP